MIYYTLFMKPASLPSDGQEKIAKARSSDRPHQVGKFVKAMTFVTGMAALGAAGCAVPAGNMDSTSHDDEVAACETAETQHQISIDNIKATYKSEFDYDPVQGIQIDLDCDIDGVTEKLTDTCGGQPELAILGTVTVQKNDNGASEEVYTQFPSQPITSNGLQHLHVSLAYPTINVRDFRVAVTGPGGKPVFNEVPFDPDRADL